MAPDCLRMADPSKRSNSLVPKPLIPDSRNYIINAYATNTKYTNHHANHIQQPNSGGLYSAHPSVAPRAYAAVGQNDGLPNGKAQHLLEWLGVGYRAPHLQA